MSGVSYFNNARNFQANNTTFNTSNTFVSDGDGTREVVICRIEGWYGFERPPEKKIMWVHGPTGYGNTAVAGSVSKQMEDKTTDLGFNPVGATFFFWRTSPERNSPKHFIITLAYQFTMSIPELAPHIEAAVKRNPMVLDKALEVQLTKLIVEPFKSLGELDDMPHRLVIIDGLDECINSDQESRAQKQFAEDQERVQVRVLELIRTLHSHNLPLCFLILSRPEPWIKQHIESRSLKSLTETVDLYEVGDHMNDVEKYVRDEQARITEALDDESGDDEKWPGEDLVQRFLWKTRGHMLYATTVIRHIDDPYDDPRRRLQDILNNEFKSTPGLAHSTPSSSLHELYCQILLSCPRANQATMVEVLEEFFAIGDIFPQLNITFPCLLDTLDRLSGRVPGRGIKAIRHLRAVVRHDTHTQSLFYHSSFPEFLKSESLLLPDVPFKLQRAVSRCLAAFCKSLSKAATVDGQASEEHIDFCLTLPPCGSGHGFGLFSCLIYLEWHMSLGMAFLIRANLLEDALSHLQSSVEGIFLRILDPDYLTSHFDSLMTRKLTFSFGLFMRQMYEHRPPAFDDVVQALRRLLEKQEELFGKLEREVLDGYLSEQQRPAIEGMFKLVRQTDKSYR